LVPFSFLGVIWGARLAAMCIAAVQAAVLGTLGTRVGPPKLGWLFGLAPLLSQSFLLRDDFARPSHLTVPLVAVCLLAGAGELSPLLAGGCAFVYGLIHLSSPLGPAFCVLGL